MPITSRFTAAGFVVTLGLVLGASCGEEPPAPSTAPRPATTSLVMVGPESVAPGASAQFNVTAHRSDGTTVEATNQVLWNSSRPSLVSISSTGVATGRASGDATISASTGAIRSTRELIVIPEGTFRVLGRVIETGLSITTPVPGAFVQVTAGPAGISTAFTDGDGRYRLYGVRGDTEIRARKAAYRDHIQRVVVTEHRTIDFALSTTIPIPEVEGSYTLTITAGASCGQRLPEAVRVRTYAASILHADARRLNVPLSGATFVGTSNHFTGRIEPGMVTFALGYYYYGYTYGDDLIEQVATDQRLSVVGSVIAEASGNRISGTLNGGIRLTTDRGTTIAACSAADHRIEFRR